MSYSANPSTMLTNLFLLVVLLLSPLVMADALQPGYLEINQQSEQRFSMLWKVPAKGDKTLRIYPVLPESCALQAEPSQHRAAGALIQRQMLECGNGLLGQMVSIDGLERLQTMVLVRISLLDGSERIASLHSDNREFKIEAEPSVLNVAGIYLVLGVEHILEGLDHLLFVLALVLIVSRLRLLVWTITAFTLAHSVTLVGATLGWLWLPSQPVEAVIALSILLLAVEIVHRQQGRVGATERWPWLVAFLFGLLHGFGFAGALQEVGLPAQSVPVALLFFNVGVEIGQLLFVAAILLLGKLFQWLAFKQVNRATTMLAYAIGTTAAFWTIDRTLSML